ncbi:hypothetical protein DERP_002713 [Dermatophagoides pteronyssinus]|uniref:Uncharacterized protein n=1 Tax=Dermatophagoides pteronyssinus TaxID=6956 RepID=A0ABQ8JVL2_DERPT|nr:hypothetical protein DERP_002713 [Dermatophagoides pteronyssinus]
MLIKISNDDHQYLPTRRTTCFSETSEISFESTFGLFSGTGFCCCSEDCTVFEEIVVAIVSNGSTNFSTNFSPLSIVSSTIKGSTNSVLESCGISTISETLNVDDKFIESPAINED